MTYGHGDHVELDIAGELTTGVVTFVERGWVYWRDTNGRNHASPTTALAQGRHAEIDGDAEATATCVK